MSSIKTTQLDGDVSVGRNVAMGGDAEIAGRVHICHNLKVDGWLDAPNIISGNKGVFLTLDALRAAYPEPRDGWLAGVGASTPFAAYTGIGGEWVATGGTIDITVDMSEYTEALEQLQEDVEDIATELQSQSDAAATEASARQQADTDLQDYVDEGIAATKQTATTELHQSTNGYLPLIVGAGFYTKTGAISGKGANTTANTGKISIADYKISQVSYQTSIGSTAYEIIFWNSNGDVLSDISVEGNGRLRSRIINLTDAEYQQATHFAISAYLPSGDFSNCYCVIGHSFDDLNIPSRMETAEEQIAVLRRQMKDVAKLEGYLCCDGYYNMNGTYLNTSVAKNTGFIEIEGYRFLSVSARLSSSGAAIAFFDSQKTFMSSIAVAGNNGVLKTSLDLSDEVYASAVYVVVSHYGTNYSEFSCILDNDKGKKILIFGDSITDSATITVNAQNETTAYAVVPTKTYVNEQGVTVRFSLWSYLISRYIKCSDLRNYALSGASYRTRNPAQGMERQNLVTQLEIAVNDINNPNGVFPTEGAFVPDIIIFALGTNDGTPTGTYDAAMAKTVMNQAGTAVDVDATLANLDTAITCDAIRFAFLKIRKYFPQSLCFCVLPIQRQSTAKPGINDVLEQFAKRYSIKVIDGAAEVGIVQDFETYNTFGANLKDGLHPNEKGQNLMTRAIVTAVRNNWIEEDFLNQ